MTTTIEINGETLTLSPDQDVALAACLEELSQSREAVLAGAAGTGKTTVMRAVLQAWDGNVMFLAPTGKAAVRLSEQAGQTARTIHSAIFGSVEEEADRDANGRRRRREKLRFGELRVPEQMLPSTLAVVDEASMVNGELAPQLREIVERAGASLLWVGDHEQLPPVEGGWGVDLTNPTARLTQVHRQALDSAVLDLATCIREERAKDFTRWGEDVTRQAGTIEDSVAWAEAGDDRVLLTWTNKVRKTANRLTRESRGYPRWEVQVGETLLCTFNAHSLGIMNGESFEVESVEPHEELSEAVGAQVIWVKPVGRTARFLLAPESFDAYHPNKSDRRIFRDTFALVWGRDTSGHKDDAALYAMMDRMQWSWDDLKQVRNEIVERSVQATWGYCLTVHKSQGSQWSEVAFVSCPLFRTPASQGGRLTPENRRRMAYTAVTRAEEKFHAFQLGTLPDYRRKDPYEVPAQAPTPAPAPRPSPEALRSEERAEFYGATERYPDEPAQEPLSDESAVIVEAGAAVDFALAGSAIFTLQNDEVGRHYTYKVSRAKPRQDGDPDPLLWFVGGLTGPNNVDDYTYLGIISSRGEGDIPVFRTTQKTRNPDGAPVMAFTDAFRGIAQGRESKWNLYHAGRCGRCSRVLTDPESIQSGIGPVCRAKMEGGE